MPALQHGTCGSIKCTPCMQALSMLEVGAEGSSHHVLGNSIKAQPNLMRYYKNLHSKYIGKGTQHWKRTLSDVSKAKS